MDSDDIKRSKFNAGIAFAERIDGLQRAINAAKFNPLASNMETGTFNYENLVVCADALISEGWDKFTPKEKELLVRMEKIMKDTLKYFPPVGFSKGGEPKLIKENYDKLLVFFSLFERKIKEIYGLHNLNNPTMDGDDDEGW